MGGEKHESSIRKRSGHWSTTNVFGLVRANLLKTVRNRTNCDGQKRNRYSHLYLNRFFFLLLLFCSLMTECLVPESRDNRILLSVILCNIILIAINRRKMFEMNPISKDLLQIFWLVDPENKVEVTSCWLFKRIKGCDEDGSDYIIALLSITTGCFSLCVLERERKRKSSYLIQCEGGERLIG